MRRQSTRGAGSRSTERGATLVEFALAFPVLVMLFLGIVDFGMNFSARIQTAHAAREVARAASVARVGHSTTCATVGIAPSTALHEAICLAKNTTGLDPSRVRVRIAYMDGDGKTTTDLSNTTTSPNSIMVCVMTAAQSVTGVYSQLFDTKAFMSRAVAKTAKPYGGAYIPIGSEDPLVGKTWSFCAADDPAGG